MKKIWGHDAASAWEDSVDARIIGATQDMQKAHALQNAIGKGTLTISINSKSRSHKDMEFRGQSSNSSSEQMREVPLITRAEITNFPPHGAIILSRRCKPILASKAIYFTRADMKNRVKSFEEIAGEIEVKQIEYHGTDVVVPQNAETASKNHAQNAPRRDTKIEKQPAPRAKFLLTVMEGLEQEIDYRDYTVIEQLPVGIEVTAIAGIHGKEGNIMCLFSDDGNTHYRRDIASTKGKYWIPELYMNFDEIGIGQVLKARV